MGDVEAAFNVTHVEVVSASLGWPRVIRSHREPGILRRLWNLLSGELRQVEWLNCYTGSLVVIGGVVSSVYALS